MTISAASRRPNDPRAASTSYSGATRLLFAPLLALLLLAGCDATQPQDHLVQGEAMGTTYSAKIRVETPPTPEQQQFLAESIARQIDAVNQTMSTYLDSSELSIFNQSRALEPFEVSRDTLEVLRQAARIGSLTDGVFDVTVGPLVNAWGFGPADRREDLSDEEIEAIRATTGWHLVEIDPVASTIKKNDPAVYVDLSAIAKGYAVDRASENLTKLGYENHMVELGGEVRVRGVNAAGRPWRIAIERPTEDGRAIQRVLPLRDTAMATSGDYRNYFEKDGRRYSHEIDPRTGRPIEHHTASVTVVHPSCAAADAWATALIVLGAEAGLAKATEQGLQALFLVREGDGFVERVTPAFEDEFGEAEEAAER